MLSQLPATTTAADRDTPLLLHPTHATTRTKHPAQISPVFFIVIENLSSRLA
jgi:hypothetical protein